MALWSFSFYGYGPHRDLHSFPTRRSSDLTPPSRPPGARCRKRSIPSRISPRHAPRSPGCRRGGRCESSSSDRKSTRLNSSHVSISYAVFCLKKKKKPYYLHQLYLRISRVL